MLIKRKWCNATRALIITKICFFYEFNNETRALIENETHVNKYMNIFRPCNGCARACTLIRPNIPLVRSRANNSRQSENYVLFKIQNFAVSSYESNLSIFRLCVCSRWILWPAEFFNYFWWYSIDCCRPKSSELKATHTEIGQSVLIQFVCCRFWLYRTNGLETRTNKRLFTSLWLRSMSVDSRRSPIETGAWTKGSLFGMSCCRATKPSIQWSVDGVCAYRFEYWSQTQSDIARLTPKCHRPIDHFLPFWFLHFIKISKDTTVGDSGRRTRITGLVALSVSVCVCVLAEVLLGPLNVVTAGGRFEFYSLHSTESLVCFSVTTHESNLVSIVSLSTAIQNVSFWQRRRAAIACNKRQWKRETRNIAPYRVIRQRASGESVSCSFLEGEMIK